MGTEVHCNDKRKAGRSVFCFMDEGGAMINATEILQAQLARSLGLDKYAEIMRGDPTSPSFQRAFNGYYRIRRNDEWRKHYFALFLRARTEDLDFSQIITALCLATGNVEASFSSKMMATIDPAKPIWDQYVLQNLGLELTGKTQEEKLKNAILLYGAIEKWYLDYLTTAEAHENLHAFDLLLPEYKWISDVKKIDCLLWSKR